MQPELISDDTMAHETKKHSLNINPLVDSTIQRLTYQIPPRCPKNPFKLPQDELRLLQLPLRRLAIELQMTLHEEVVYGVTVLIRLGLSGLDDFRMRAE